MPARIAAVICLLLLLGCQQNEEKKPPARNVLADPAFGYSVALPDGWRPLPSTVLVTIRDSMDAWTDVKLTAEELRTVRGAGVPGGMFGIAALSLASFHTSKEDLDQMAAGDSSFLEAARDELVRRLSQNGGKVVSSAVFKDGIKIVVSIRDPNAPDKPPFTLSVYQRYTKTNVLLYFTLQTDAERKDLDLELDGVLESLTIASDKHL